MRAPRLKFLPPAFLAIATAAVTMATAQAAPLGFDEAIDAIIARSMGVAAQQASEAATRARNLPTRLAFVPSLSFDASQSTTGGDAYTQSVTKRGVQGVAQMDLFRWGADVKGLQAAWSDEDQQAALTRSSGFNAQDAAVSALVTHIQRKKEIEVAERIVKMRKESMAIAEQRFAGGYLPLQEKQKIAVDLSNAQSNLADAQVASATATASLIALLGHDQVQLEWAWKGRAIPPTASQPPQDLDRLLSARPDWQAAEARSRAESHRASRAWRLMLPSLDGQFAYGFGYTLGNPGSTQWTGTLSVRLPFFDRLTLLSGARAQSYVSIQADSVLEQVRRDARADWESARQTYLTSLASARVRDETLEISRKLYNDNLQRFKAGRINANELLFDQDRVLSSERLAIQGWAAVHTAYSRFCNAQALPLSACSQ